MSDQETNIVTFNFGSYTITALKLLNSSCNCYIAGSETGWLKIFSITNTTHHLEQRYIYEDITDLDVLSNNSIILVDASGFIRVSVSSSILRNISTGVGDILKVNVLSNGNLACGFENGSIFIYNMQTGNRIIRNMTQGDRINDLEPLPSNGELLSVANSNNFIFRWNTNNGVKLSEISLGRDGICLKLIDNNRVAVAVNNHHIRIYDLSNNALIKTFTGHTNIVNELEFVSDTMTLISISVDKTIRRWNTLDASTTHLSRSNTTWTPTSIEYLYNGSKSYKDFYV